jgi:hypothetical protein
MTILESNGHVGINKTNPGGMLSIKADISGDIHSGLHFDPVSGTQDWYMYIAGDDALTIRDDNNDVITIETGGHVGIETTSPNAGLDVNTDVILGVSGTRFMEIRQITGTTNATGYYTQYIDKLSVGWTGAKTRLLSLEMQVNSSTGNWVGVSNTSSGISYYLDNDGRTVWIHYPNEAAYHSRPWRAMVMRMP